MGDTRAGIAPQTDTYANWVSANPTLGKDDSGDSFSQIIFATDSPVGDILIWGNDQTFTASYAAGQFIKKSGQDDGVLVGSEKKFFTSKDRSAQGYLEYALSNAVLQATYADLYADVGDIFEQMHLDAGDPASGAGDFYPTPVPGYTDRSGIPDTAAIDATADIDDTTELITLTTADYNSFKAFKSVGGDGVPVRAVLLTGALPGGIVDGETVYYIRFKTTPDIELYDTEANAIDTSGTTGRIDLTDAVGTFNLTQQGIAYDDAGQGHRHNLWAQQVNNLGGASSLVSTAGVANTLYTYRAVDDPVTDTVNGTPRTSNETRGRNIITFNYIKALTV